MKHYIYFVLVLLSAQFLIADDVEEVTVTASLIDQNLSEIGDPVQVCLLYTSPSPRDS